MSKRLYYINARVDSWCQQIEIEADTEEEAHLKYLEMAHTNQLAVDEVDWHSLHDIEIDDHGEGNTLRETLSNNNGSDSKEATDVQ